MKIDKDQIKEAKLAGHTKDKKPVAYVLSKGGLHCFFTTDDDGKTLALSAAPHIAIARHFAEKKVPIEWEEDFMLKSEAHPFVKLREMFFHPEVLNKSEDSMSTEYLVYKTSDKVIETYSLDEVREAIKSGEVHKYDLIRPADLSKRDIFVEDFEML